MRVFAYVDGFNLYHGALEGTSPRWLDLRALCDKLMYASDDVARIKYPPGRFRQSMSSRSSTGSFGPERWNAAE